MKIENLTQFLEEVGAETPWRAGRILYKYTSCGPWITYLVEKSPARTAAADFRVSIQDKKLTAAYMENWEPGDSQLVKEALDFLGFDPCEPKWWIGKARKWKSLSAYLKRLRAFLAKEVIGTRRFEFQIGDTSRHHLDLHLFRRIPAEIEEVYYETDRANRPIENCIGIKMGSIVEGSEAYVDRDAMHFPFESQDFWAMVKSINDEADFYWRRDNLDHYIVTHRGREYYIESGWGNDLKLPESIKQVVQDYIHNNHEIEPDKETTIPNTKIKLTKVDTTFDYY